MNTNPKDIEHVLTSGVAEVLPTREKLAAFMATGKRLRLYVGVDPTSPHLHIGHALQFMKLREFQDLGHEVILLIGSFTAMIGDPTDKLAARKQLTRKEVLANAKTYKKQVGKILNFSGRNAVKLKFNDKWLAKLNFQDVVELASHFTVQQMMERDMFEKRLTEGKPIHMHEFFYPLMQGYDSVAMDVDIEIGGSDQTFNMLAGRTLQRTMKNREKYVVSLKLLTNDEGKKMSKSEGGVIGLEDAPEDKYGKIMAMEDGMILPYFELVLRKSGAELALLAKAKEMDPRATKAQLAREVTAFFDGDAAALKAEEHFNTIFRSHEMPTEMPEHKLGGPNTIVDVLVETELVSSRGEARRMLEQGAIKVNGNAVNAIETVVASGDIVQRGKRQFVRIK